jgi:hypothetical protein
MTDDQHDQQPGEPIAARTDPKLILDAIQTGIETVGVGYAILKGTGSDDPPPPPPPPEPSQPETPPMPGFNE